MSEKERLASDVTLEESPPPADMRGKTMGEWMFDYWLWLCRSEQNDWSPHPLGIPNKKIPGSNLDFIDPLL